MLIDKKISEYLIFESESILKALEKINSNKRRIIFVVSEHGLLVGALTDGDFRRWITKTSSYDLSKKVSSITNTNIVSAMLAEDKIEISKKFTSAVNVIPLKDSSSRLIAIAIRDEQGFIMGGTTISDESNSFIIAEIGNNHNGDVNLAKTLVDLACDAGADCVKFQMRNMASLYKAGAEAGGSSDLGAEYTMDLLKKFQLTNSELISVFDYCKSKDLMPLCTPWDLESLLVLEDYGMEAYKVASADLTNHELLEALIETGKPLICSTGMSTEFEIKKSVEFLRRRGANFALLHCNSTYPTPFKDINLAYLSRLKDISGGPVGYSGHERGISVPIAAVALGAKIIEKHFTVDKSMEGNDHKVSLLPQEFKAMVEEIRKIEESLGENTERKISQGELLNRETLAKSIVAKTIIASGDGLTREMLDFKSPGEGLQPMYIDQLLGKKAKRDFVVGDCFYESDLQEVDVEPRDYKFKRPFGIPVRYHDYKKLVAKSNFDFVEFHLSYQDMSLDLNDFFSDQQVINFAVHSPELFEGDHIMDLASDDDSYCKKSIAELERVCNITRELKTFFPKTQKPLIVINAGGFSSRNFLDKKLTPDMYKKVGESLRKVDQEGVEIIIQTMPPFPWHFGGQSHHNLFVDPYEIRDFCEKYGYRICYDTSHSMMSSTYYQWELSDFTEIVGPYVAHMHIVDALGVDGEGIEVGGGDVDFELLSSKLDKYNKDTMFLPEVWQGHKNRGEGFWKALEFLEGVGL
jgi:sialic acid synthase SpsE/sugar phosphate isomerase/epimerase